MLLEDEGEEDHTEIDEDFRFGKSKARTTFGLSASIMRALAPKGVKEGRRVYYSMDDVINSALSSVNKTCITGSARRLKVEYLDSMLACDTYRFVLRKEVEVHAKSMDSEMIEEAKQKAENVLNEELNEAKEKLEQAQEEFDMAEKSMESFADVVSFLPSKKKKTKGKKRKKKEDK